MTSAATATRQWRGVDDDLALLVSAKGDQRVAVAIPARDEERTVGPIVAEIVELLLHRHPLVDQLIVADDGSTDSTADVARAAGARVITTARRGKGQALRRAVASTDAEVLVFLDADVANFGHHFVRALLEPLLCHEHLVMVKAAYRRPLRGRSDEGGRVTELLARPLLDRFWPELAHLSQPLAGECALRRQALDHITLADNYAIEIALLLDVNHRYGPDAIGQADLGERIHRNRPLKDLTVQARSVLAAVLERVEAPALHRQPAIPCSVEQSPPAMRLPETGGGKEA